MSGKIAFWSRVSNCHTVEIKIDLYIAGLKRWRIYACKTLATTKSPRRAVGTIERFSDRIALAAGDATNFEAKLPIVPQHRPGNAADVIRDPLAFR